MIQNSDSHEGFAFEELTPVGNKGKHENGKFASFELDPFHFKAVFFFFFLLLFFSSQ